MKRFLGFLMVLAVGMTFLLATAPSASAANTQKCKTDHEGNKVCENAYTPQVVRKAWSYNMIGQSYVACLYVGNCNGPIKEIDVTTEAEYCYPGTDCSTGPLGAGWKSQREAIAYCPQFGANQCDMGDTYISAIANFTCTKNGNVWIMTRVHVNEWDNTGTKTDVGWLHSLAFEVNCSNVLPAR